jgi:hypothetical protein
MERQCGDCQLCCKLLPVHDLYTVEADALHKKAGERCPYQKHKVGCTIYNTKKMPACCSVWNCRWLVGEVPRDIGRPDRVHYVVDVMPDFITLKNGDQVSNVQVVQIWCDPSYPNAHRDPALRCWLEELSHQQIVGMVRFDERDCLCIFPPAMSDDGQWHEVSPAGMQSSKTHSLTDIVAALGGHAKIVMGD